MCFCYIIYSASTMEMLGVQRTSRIENTSVGFGSGRRSKVVSRSNKILHFDGPITDRRSVSLKPTGNPLQSGNPENEFRLTNQLAIDKALQLLNMFREQMLVLNNENDKSEPLVDVELYNDFEQQENDAENTQESNEASNLPDTYQRRYSVKSFRSGRRSKVVELNDTLMINPDCNVQIIIDYIYTQLNIDRTVNIDFCDENGNMLELFKMKPHENAASVFENRKNYYLVSYELEDDQSYRSVVPLIKLTNPRESDILRKLRKNCLNINKPIRRKSSHILHTHSPNSADSKQSKK